MKKTLAWRTSLLAAALSASGSAGLFCLVLVLFSGLSPIGAHPLEVGFGVAGGCLTLVVSILLLCFYICEREKHPSILGVLHDLVLLTILFFPFFFLWSEIEVFLSRIF